MYIIYNNSVIYNNTSGHNSNSEPKWTLCRPHLWKGPPALPWPDTGEEQGLVEPLDEVSWQEAEWWMYTGLWDCFVFLPDFFLINLIWMDRFPGFNYTSPPHPWKALGEPSLGLPPQVPFCHYDSQGEAGRLYESFLKSIQMVSCWEVLLPCLDCSGQSRTS